VFFNYGVDTGTVWKSAPFHEPILWRHVTWDAQSPDRELKERSKWGWLFYRRVKTCKAFYRPMNHVVHAHLKSILPENLSSEAPVFLGGGARPNARFQELCALAGIRPRTDVETGAEEPWELKDLRKTCATYYDEHLPESSVEILGHSVGGITYRHYAHRAPLAFKSIMTLPQPTAFSALLHGHEGECPCCRRRFADAGVRQQVAEAFGDFRVVDVRERLLQADASLNSWFRDCGNFPHVAPRSMVETVAQAGRGVTGNERADWRNVQGSSPCSCGWVRCRHYPTTSSSPTLSPRTTAR
jgi:hypothetical protein